MLNHEYHSARAESGAVAIAILRRIFLITLLSIYRMAHSIYGLAEAVRQITSHGSSETLVRKCRTSSSHHAVKRYNVIGHTVSHRLFHFFFCVTSSMTLSLCAKLHGPRLHNFHRIITLIENSNLHPNTLPDLDICPLQECVHFFGRDNKKHA